LVSATQLVRHAFAPPQMYGAHEIIIMPEQLPAPLQAPCVVSTSPEHEGVLQTVLLPYFSQEPPAAQLPSVPQPDAGVCLQVPLGSGVPAEMEAQVPLAPPVSAPRHDWHWPLHALVQQTLVVLPLTTAVTQLLLWHWVASAVGLHVVPLASLVTHWPALQ
jgi:hypothetical protein